jgi:tetratricopeptide (TPR) repeat protein
MRSLFLILVLSCGVVAWSQNSTPSNSTPSKAQPPDSTPSKPTTAQDPNLAPPRSDTINANELGGEPGQSSSKDTLIDLSPPADDAKAHPQNSDALKDEGRPSSSSDVGEFHPWNPHKAAKDIEVGDFYFKRKNYRAAEDRYREALFYKDNDAVATFRLAQCLEKMDQPDEARKEYESYLKILPHGPQAEAAHKAIDRLKGTAANAEGGR